MRTKYLFLFIGVAFVTVAGLGCKQSLTIYETRLNVWGVFDSEGDHRTVNSEYTKNTPFVSNIGFRKFTIDTYKDDLINALAAGTGPDVFMIHNTWLPDFIDKVTPAPENMITTQDIKNSFVDVVSQDVIVDGRIYAVPQSVDSLALYYNKDIFNAAGITAPPSTWAEFEDVVRRVTRIDEEGRILQSGAAFGTSENINRAEDILTVLMMQGGAQMLSGDRAVFHEPQTVVGQTVNPGRNALLYYTSFARGDADVYTWNKKQHYSLDAFFEGDTAMMVNYSYHYDTIKAKNAKLNFAVAPLPQIDATTIGSQTNFANYWMYVVAKNRPLDAPGGGNATVTNDMRIWESWQYLKNLTMHTGGPTTLYSALGGEATGSQLADLAQVYLNETHKPAARRDLIQEQLASERYSPFAGGNLIARNYRRKSADRVDAILRQMIDDVNKGGKIADALEQSTSRITQLQ